MDAGVICLGVVDDHSILRDGVKRALSLESDFKVVGEGGSADDAIALCDRLRPNVMLIDLKMPGGGINAVGEVHRRHPDVGIIVMTVEDLDTSVNAALAAGARGYILKGCNAHELIDAVRMVAAGGTYITPDLAAALLLSNDDRNVPQKDEAPAERLSGRERQIYALLAKGRNNREIATELELSEKTVKWYVSVILSKLGLESRLQVVVAAGDRAVDTPGANS